MAERQYDRRTLPGSEEIQTYPGRNFGQNEYGIPHYGRLHGAYKIAKEHAKPAETIGYTIVSIKTHYAFVKPVEAANG